MGEIEVNEVGTDAVGDGEDDSVAVEATCCTRLDICDGGDGGGVDSVI